MAKDTAKAYGSMVIYVTKASDVTRLLRGCYFHVGGEFAYTSAYERRSGPRNATTVKKSGTKPLRARRRKYARDVRKKATATVAAAK